MVPNIDWQSLTLSQEHQTVQEGFSGMAGSPCRHACERKEGGIVEVFTDLENKKQLHHCTSAIRNRTSIPLNTISKQDSQLQIYMKSARKLGGSNPERSSL